ncbi:MAG: hypothetical protein JWP34_4688, partial [Massilia sp.]|nr:hypothetical protein [Massilia sp.]
MLSMTLSDRTPRQIEVPLRPCGQAVVGLTKITIYGRRTGASAACGGPVRYMLMICDDESVQLGPEEIARRP